jgi:hypothetical protein
MIRLASMLPQALMIGIIEMVNKVGPEQTSKWLTYIGNEMALTQGPGLEGDPDDLDLNYLPLCPFANELLKFFDLFGERPEEFKKITEYVTEREAINKNKVEYPAVSNILCLLHNAYRKKRALMAGYETLHLASCSPLPNVLPAYNEEAIKAAGISREQVDELLKKGVCIFKFIKTE